MKKLVLGLALIGGALVAIRGFATMQGRKRREAEEQALELEVERMEGEGGPASA